MKLFPPILAGRRSPRASFSFDATRGTLPTGSTFTRASGATRVDNRGRVEEVGANTPRFTYDPGLTYNDFSNPWFEGATPGVVGSGGVAPSDVWFGVMSGVTREIVGTGITPDGLPYWDFRLFAQTPATNNFVIAFGTGSATAGPTATPVVPGDTLSYDCGMAIVGGGMDGLVELRLWPSEYNEAGTLVAQGGAGTVSGVALTGAVQRIRTQRVVSNAAARRATVALHVRTSGQPFDITLRFVAPVINVGATYLADAVPLASLVARIGAIPQHGLLGLLLEEASTNLSTNTRCEGAVVGSPGTPPTAWTISGVGGWSHAIVGTGVEGGISYVDIRIWSPANNGNINNYRINILPVVTLLANTTYAFSAYMRIVAGAASGFTFRMGIGAAHTPANEMDIPAPGSAPLIRQRFIKTRTIGAADEASTFVWLGVATPGPNGAGTGDVTIRIGLPQLEVRPTATSPIMPPAGSPASASRAKDRLVLAQGLWRGDADTVYLDGIWNRATAGNAFSLNMVSALGSGDGTSASINVGTLSPGLADFAARVFNAGVLNAVIRGAGGGAVPTPTAKRVCFAYGGGSAVASWDGLVPTVDESAPTTAPTGATTTELNAAAASADWIVRRLRIWRGKKLTNVQVQAQSARTS